MASDFIFKWPVFKNTNHQKRTKNIVQYFAASLFHTMVLRSAKIPAVLNRICDERIPSALLVTFEGEILGESTAFPHQKTPEALGALVADIASDYQRAGEDYAAIEGQRSKSHLECLLISMSDGLIGVSACDGVDCFVIATAKPDAPPGLLKGRLESLASFVQDSMSILTESAWI